jgi:hypothetical protein
MNMYPIVGVFEASREGGKGEENDREWMMLKFIASVQNKTQQNALKAVK